MSYDLVIWRIKPGTTLDQMNAWLAEHNAEEGDEADDDVDIVEIGEDEVDEEEEEMPPFVDIDVDGSACIPVIAKAYLRALFAEDDRSPRLHAWLSEPGNSAPPDDLDGDESMCLHDLEEYAGPGNIFFPMGYSDDLVERLEGLWPFVRDIWPLGFAVYDPQLGRIVDPVNGLGELRQSGESALEFYEKVVGSLQSGGDVSTEMSREDFERMVGALKDADAQAQEGNFEEALALYMGAWELIPAPRERFEGTRAVAASIGQLHAVLGDLTEGLAWLAIAEGCPGASDDGPLQLLHGQILFFMGREDDAREHLERAHSAGGDELFEDVPELLDFLRQG